MDINVTTKFDPSTIDQSIWTEAQNGLKDEISRNIISLRDQGIREALIAIGWTPPVNGKKPSASPLIDQTPKKIADLTERLAAVESRHEDACATDDEVLADMLEHLSAYIEQEIADLTAGQ